MELFSFPHESSVQGTVRFHYRGWIISISTGYKPSSDGELNDNSIYVEQELMIRKDGDERWTDRMTWEEDVDCIKAIIKAKEIIDQKKES